VEGQWAGTILEVPAEEIMYVQRRKIICHDMFLSFFFLFFFFFFFFFLSYFFDVVDVFLLLLLLLFFVAASKPMKSLK